MHRVAAHRFYNPPPVLPEVQHISGQPQPVTVPFPNQSPITQCPNQPLFAQPPIQPPFALPHHQPPFPQPMSSDQSQGQPVLMDLDVQWNQTIPHDPTPKESFLGMLLPPSVFERPTPIPSFTADTVDVDDESLTTSSSSLADTVIIDRSPQTEYGEGSSGSSEEMLWEPCRACKTEVAKLMKETVRMKDVLSSIGKLILFSVYCIFLFKATLHPINTFIKILSLPQYDHRSPPFLLGKCFVFLFLWVMTCTF